MANFKSDLKLIFGTIVTYALTRGIQVGAAMILEKYFKIKVEFGPENDPLLKLGVKKIPFEQVFLMLPALVRNDFLENNLDALPGEEFDC
jgi:hypothetical protein